MREADKERKSRSKVGQPSRKARHANKLGKQIRKATLENKSSGYVRTSQGGPGGGPPRPSHPQGKRRGESDPTAQPFKTQSENPSG